MTQSASSHILTLCCWRLGCMIRCSLARHRGNHTAGTPVLRHPRSEIPVDVLAGVKRFYVSKWSTVQSTQYSENHTSAVRATLVLYSVSNEHTLPPFASDRIQVQVRKTLEKQYLHILYHVVEGTSYVACLVHCQCIRLHKIVQMCISSLMFKMCLVKLWLFSSWVLYSCKLQIRTWAFPNAQYLSCATQLSGSATISSYVAPYCLYVPGHVFDTHYRRVCLYRWQVVAACCPLSVLHWPNAVR